MDTFNCFNDYCPKSNTCEWFICPNSEGIYIDDETAPEDKSCYKELEITVRCI